MSASEGPGQIRALDGIRGLAALMVMFFHYWQSGGWAGVHMMARLGKASIAGQTGVDLFFVLSGFLITRILISTRTSTHYFTYFYVRRALRILPLYYLFLVLFLLVKPLVGEGVYHPIHETWWYWVYLQNVPLTFPGFHAWGPVHYWSLAVEEHFYLVWPLVVYWVPPRRLVAASCAFIAAAVACRAWFVFGLHLQVFYFTLCRVDALALGTLLAALEARQGLTLMRRGFAWVLGLGAVGLVFVWLHWSGSAAPVLETVKYTMVGLVFASLIGLAVVYGEAGWTRLLLLNSPILFMGRISYGLYVYHQMCFALVKHAPGMEAASAWVRFPCSFSLAVAVSWISFRLIELPVLKLKRHFTVQAGGAGQAG